MSKRVDDTFDAIPIVAVPQGSRLAPKESYDVTGSYWASKVPIVDAKARSFGAVAGNGLYVSITDTGNDKRREVIVDTLAVRCPVCGAPARSPCKMGARHRERSQAAFRQGAQQIAEKLALKGTEEKRRELEAHPDEPHVLTELAEHINTPEREDPMASESMKRKATDGVAKALLPLKAHERYETLVTLTLAHAHAVGKDATAVSAELLALEHEEPTE